MAVRDEDLPRRPAAPAAHWILHVSLDGFMAAVEVLRHPQLAGRPIVVGGHGEPTDRGTVESMSEEAARFGIKHRMTLRSARRRCPDLVVLPLALPACLEVSRLVMDVLRGFGGVADAGRLGEASLTRRTDDPEALAREIQRCVLEAAGLRCTVGIGDTEARAVLASHLAEPGGVFTLTRENWDGVMRERSPDVLVGIDRGRAAKLRAKGIGTVTDLAAANPRTVADLFGPSVGAWLRFVATGEDPVPAHEGSADRENGG